MYTPRLGERVKDIPTGLTGIVAGKTKLYSGLIQYAIQPEGDGKTVPDALNFDPNCLQFVDAGISHEAVPAKPVSFDVGDEVKDNVTGITGIVLAITTFLNGCVYVRISVPSKYWSSLKQEDLIVVSDRLTLKKARKVATGSKGDLPGGPITRAIRIT